MTSLETTGPILPPFNFNSSEIAAHSPEVTGLILLKSLCRRLGWASLEGRKLLDFGCGVRFARTIYNLDVDISLYAGIDVNAEAIEWLRCHVKGPRFRFVHFDMAHTMYNPGGSLAPEVPDFGGTQFDAACMFSVITHQAPDEAATVLHLLRSYVPRLYFTAMIDDGRDTYFEGDPLRPRNLSTYPTTLITRLLATAGWHVEATYPPSLFQMTAFVCR
jgi:hypothetical protein